ncbi:MAG TPA: DUF1501 domain-containing protein [Planctomycetes bacterium]|nr:DUF1501 domain-containing protein [Planctomycetota bacterium]
MSTLIADLDERGMFDDTLVLCLTEHGRSPKINNADRGGDAIIGLVFTA